MPKPLSNFRQQHVTGFSQRQLAISPMEQLRADMLLKLLNLVANG
jgi:hypothetical protein